MDARSLLLATLLAAAAQTSPLRAGASTPREPSHARDGDEDDRSATRERCARTRAYPTWCRDLPREDAERERVRPRDTERPR